MSDLFVFENKNHKKIRGKMYAPQDKNRKYPVVIWSHGFNSCYADLEHHGPGLAQAGICCFFYDFCGGGTHTTSDGTMLEMTIPSECEDLETVIAEIRKLDYVDSDQIFLLGESQGGYVSALCALKLQEQIKGLVMWYPAFVIPDDSKKRFATGDNQVFGFDVSPQFNETAMNYDVYHEIAAFQKPVLIIHGDQDAIVPVSYSERAAKVYEDAKLIIIPKAGHGFDGADSTFAREQSIKFVLEHASDTDNQYIKELKKLPGNDVIFSPENVNKLSKSKLQGKHFIFLGSSVTYGAASLGVAFPEYLQARDGISFVKEAVSGTTLVSKDKDSYIPRMHKVDNKLTPDYFVCQLSTNDATQGMPFGIISDSFEKQRFDTSTIAGAIEYIIAYARETWHCPVYFYTGTRYDSQAYGEMVDLLLQIQKKWNIGVIDLWNDEKMNAISQDDYDLYMKDPIHPTQAGYLKWWTPKFEEVLQNEI